MPHDFPRAARVWPLCHYHRPAYSLVELIGSVAVMMVVLATVCWYIQTLARANRAIGAEVKLQQNVRRLARRLRHDLRRSTEVSTNHNGQAELKIASSDGRTDSVTYQILDDRIVRLEADMSRRMHQDEYQIPSQFRAFWRRSSPGVGGVGAGERLRLDIQQQDDTTRERTVSAVPHISIAAFVGVDLGWRATAKSMNGVVPTKVNP